MGITQLPTWDFINQSNFSGCKQHNAVYNCVFFCQSIILPNISEYTLGKQSGYNQEYGDYTW